MWTNSGPLPREGTYTSKGETLIISVSGSGFRGTDQSLSAGRIGMRVEVNSGERGFANIFANERNSYEAFSGEFIVVEGLPAGEHTIRLEEIDFLECRTQRLKTRATTALPSTARMFSGWRSWGSLTRVEAERR